MRFGQAGVAPVSTQTATAPVDPTAPKAQVTTSCAAMGLGGIFLFPIIGAGVGAAIGAHIGDRIDRPAIAPIVGAIAGLPGGFLLYKQVVKMKCS